MHFHLRYPVAHICFTSSTHKKSARGSVLTDMSKMTSLVSTVETTGRHLVFLGKRASQGTFLEGDVSFRGRNPLIIKRAIHGYVLPLYNWAMAVAEF